MEDATEEMKTPPTKTNHQKNEGSPALSQSSNSSQDELGKATSPPKLQTSSQHLTQDGFITPENYSQRPISRSCQHNLDEFGIERQASQESNASLPDPNVPQDFMRGKLPFVRCPLVFVFPASIKVLYSSKLSTESSRNCLFQCILSLCFYN